MSCHVSISSAENDQEEVVGLNTEELCHIDLANSDVSVRGEDIQKVVIIVIISE